MQWNDETLSDFQQTFDALPEERRVQIDARVTFIFLNMWTCDIPKPADFPKTVPDVREPLLSKLRMMAILLEQSYLPFTVVR